MKSEGPLTLVHTQEESSKKELTSEHSSSYETAEVRSVLTSEVSTLIQLSTSSQLDLLLDSLKKNNVHFDVTVQQRIGQVTEQSELVIGQIIRETEKNQQQLLQRAREEQLNEDRDYREKLQHFLQELDQRRAMQLNNIQQNLQRRREEIGEESQLKLRSLTEQANSLKAQIMAQEENKASQQMETIIEQINTMNRDPQLQQLGTTNRTNIQLTIEETVGTSNSNNKDKVTRMNRTTINNKPTSPRTQQTNKL